METTITERELLCTLNDVELRERGDTMAEAELAIERLKVERRKLNAQIREQSDRRAELAQAIDARAETRMVSCEWTPDYARKTWQLRRMDTGVTLEQTAMTEADLQSRLPLADDDELGDAPVAAAPKRKRGRPRKAAAHLTAVE